MSNFYGNRGTGDRTSRSSSNKGKNYGERSFTSSKAKGGLTFVERYDEPKTENKSSDRSFDKPSRNSSSYYKKPYSRDEKRSFGDKGERKPYSRDEHKSFGDRSERKPYSRDEHKSFGDRGERKPYSRDEHKSFGDRGERKPYSRDEKRSFGDRGERKPYSRDEKRSYGDRSERKPYSRDEHKSFGDRSERKPYSRDEHKSFGDRGERKPYSRDEHKSFGDRSERKPYSRDEHKSFGDRSERKPYSRDEHKSFGDRSERKPYSRDEHKSFGDRGERKPYSRDEHKSFGGRSSETRRGGSDRKGSYSSRSGGFSKPYGASRERRSFGSNQKGGRDFSDNDGSHPEYTENDLIKGIFRATDKGFGFLEVAGKENDLFVPASRTAGASDGDTVEARFIGSSQKGDDVAIVRVIEADSSSLITGVFRANERGFGFLTIEGREEDLFVPASKTCGAFNGDTVEARFVGRSQKGDDVEIVRVVSRGKTELSGVFIQSGSKNYVRPDDRAYLSDIEIKKDCTLNAKTGDKVLVRMLSFEKHMLPLGEVIDVFGEAFSLFAEEESIIADNGIEREFSPAVLEIAKKMPKKVLKKDMAKRLDFRNTLTFTIDGESSRDFDDAVSLTKNEKGNYVLGVHIADVSNYVKAGEVIDLTAYTRATSVYFPDRVIPMLPVELSNGICSLNEGVDRLTLSVLIELDSEANILKKEFFESVICSNRRLTYTLVQKLIEGDKALIDQNSDIYDTVINMYNLSLKLKQKRYIDGSVDLGVREAEINYNNGEITVAEHQKNEATELIEQFMVLANECVAELLTEKEIPCVYRVHGSPLEEKVENLKSALHSLGVNSAEITDGEDPMQFNKLLEKVADENIAPIVNRLVLRTMQKAVYDGENIGHFGLASECYCHFTSPIRRYPDLVVHRILKDYLENVPCDDIKTKYSSFVQSASIQSSEKEQLSESAERDVDDLYKVFYMQDKIDEEYEGIISGVTSFGIFVELANTIEGLVRIENLPGGYYDFDSKALTLSNRNNRYCFGDSVKIKVVSCDVSSRRIDFVLVD